MSQQTITLQPGSTQAVTASGKFLNIVSATAAFKVEMDNHGQNSAVVGSQLSSAQPFSRLVFTETAGLANTITFDAGDTPSPGRATTVAADSSTFVGANSNLYILGSAGTSPGQTTFPGTDAQGRQRKSIIITNWGYTAIGGSASTSVVLVWLNTGSNIQAAVWPQKTLTIETDADVTIAAGTQDVGLSQPTKLAASIIEIFYTKPLQTDQ